MFKKKILIIGPNIYKYNNGVVNGYKSLLSGLKKSNIPYSFIAGFNLTLLNFIHIFFTDNIYLISFPQKITLYLAKKFPQKLFFVATDSVDSNYSNNIGLFSLKNVYKIQPSLEYKKYYLRQFPEINSNKILVRHYGINADHITKNDKNKKRNDFYIYIKHGNAFENEKDKKTKNTLLRKITSHLNKSNTSYQIIEYGKYELKNWFNLLSSSKYGIFITGIESQGIAKIESIIHRVPFLNFEIKNNHNLSTFSFISSNIGINFYDFDDFLKKINKIKDITISTKTINLFSETTQSKKLLYLFKDLKKYEKNTPHDS